MLAGLDIDFCDGLLSPHSPLTNLLSLIKITDRNGQDFYPLLIVSCPFYLQIQHTTDRKSAFATEDRIRFCLHPVCNHISPASVCKYIQKFCRFLSAFYTPRFLSAFVRRCVLHIAILSVSVRILHVVTFYL